MLSLKFNVAMLKQDLDNGLRLEVRSCHIELTDIFRDNWFLALYLEVELDLVLRIQLNLLLRHCLACLLKILQHVGVVFSTDETKNEVLTNEDDTTFLGLEFVSVLRHKTEVECWCWRIRLDKV